MNVIANSAVSLKMIFIRLLLWYPIMRVTRNPSDAQKKVLLHILKTNKATSYGKDHGFENINSIEDYRASVPVNRYEDLRDYIRTQEAEKKPQLNSQQPVMYARTSGTTSEPKYIPILKQTIVQHRRNQNISAFAEYLAIPGVFAGKVLAIVSPAVEGYLDSGTAFGSMSGLVYQSMPNIIRSKYVVPPDVFELTDNERKYYLITKHAIAEEDISMIATANPSTLLKIDEIMNLRSDELLREIDFNSPKRARDLHNLLDKKGVLLFEDVWPKLKAVTIWTSGSCGVLIPALKKRLSGVTKIVEMGYLSSEFRGGITIDPIANKQIPTLHENFFEFVEKSLWEAGAPVFLSLDEIEEGKQYYVFTTTQSGLYRYDIDDIIEVTGRFNETPTIRFVQKGKGITNLTGEKLYESQLIQAISRLEKSQNVELQFFMMLGDAERLEYVLYIQHPPFDACDLEKFLGEINIEFFEKIKSKRLKPLRILFVRDGTAEAYKQNMIESGQREGQLKIAYLQHRGDCLFDFSPYILEKCDSTP